MAFGQSDPSRSEKPTKKRVRKARNKGNVAKSAELSKVMTLLTGVVFLRLFFDVFTDKVKATFIWFFQRATHIEINTDVAYELLVWSLRQITLIVLPFMLTIAFVAYLTIRLQVGKLWTTEPLRPNFGRMFNLMRGIKKILISPQALIRFGRSMLQALAVGIAPYIVLRQERDNVIPLFYATTDGIAAYILLTGYKMIIYTLMPMMIIALAHLWYTRWNYTEQLKMTKDEVKDERRQTEGDPAIKAEQHRRMMAVMMRRMMSSVPKADVVVTNPTHLACALRYNVLEAPAPVLLAKGANQVAERIKAIAKEHDIPIRENKPLAQALYKQVEIGDAIPEEMYQAVAAILAKLDRFKKNR